MKLYQLMSATDGTRTPVMQVANLDEALDRCILDKVDEEKTMFILLMDVHPAKGMFISDAPVVYVADLRRFHNSAQRKSAHV